MSIYDTVFFISFDIEISCPVLYIHSNQSGGFIMKVTPLEDRVLIKTAELEERTASGLFIPQTAQEKTQIGIVEAIGSDKETIKVKIGQKIMYDKYAGTGIKVDGADYLILKSKDILAIIED